MKKSVVLPPSASPGEKKVGISWYVKLNLMVMGFLCVLFLIKQINTSSFKVGLEHIFLTGSERRERSVRIQHDRPEKVTKKDAIK